MRNSLILMTVSVTTLLTACWGENSERKKTGETSQVQGRDAAHADTTPGSMNLTDHQMRQLAAYFAVTSTDDVEVKQTISQHGLEGQHLVLPALMGQAAVQERWVRKIYQAFDKPLSDEALELWLARFEIEGFDPYFATLTFLLNSTFSEPVDLRDFMLGALDSMKSLSPTGELSVEIGNPLLLDSYENHMHYLVMGVLQALDQEFAKYLHTSGEVDTTSLLLTGFDDGEDSSNASHSPTPTVSPESEGSPEPGESPSPTYAPSDYAYSPDPNPSPTYTPWDDTESPSTTSDQPDVEFLADQRPAAEISEQAKAAVAKAVAPQPGALRRIPEIDGQKKFLAQAGQLGAGNDLARILAPNGDAAFGQRPPGFQAGGGPTLVGNPWGNGGFAFGRIGGSGAGDSPLNGGGGFPIGDLAFGGQGGAGPFGWAPGGGFPLGRAVGGGDGPQTGGGTFPMGDLAQGGQNGSNPFGRGGIPNGILAPNPGHNPSGGGGSGTGSIINGLVVGPHGGGQGGAGPLGWASGGGSGIPNGIIFNPGGGTGGGSGQGPGGNMVAGIRLPAGGGSSGGSGGIWNGIMAGPSTGGGSGMGGWMPYYGGDDTGFALH